MKTIRRVPFLAFTLALGLVWGQDAKPSKEIDAEELSKLLAQPGKVFFLDVREPDEIVRLGSVKGYVNIPMRELEARLKEIPKDKPIVTL